MESKALRNWAIFHAAITSVLILGSWVLVAGSWAALGPMIDRMKISEALNLLLVLVGMGLMFFVPFFWSYRLIKKTAAHVSTEGKIDQRC
jgi:hypothetical protein